MNGYNSNLSGKIYKKVSLKTLFLFILLNLCYCKTPEFKHHIEQIAAEGTIFLSSDDWNKLSFKEKTILQPYSLPKRNITTTVSNWVNTDNLCKTVNSEVKKLSLPHPDIEEIIQLINADLSNLSNTDCYLMLIEDITSNSNISKNTITNIKLFRLLLLKSKLLAEQNRSIESIATLNYILHLITNAEDNTNYAYWNNKTISELTFQYTKEKDHHIKYDSINNYNQALIQHNSTSDLEKKLNTLKFNDDILDSKEMSKLIDDIFLEYPDFKKANLLLALAKKYMLEGKKSIAISLYKESTEEYSNTSCDFKKFIPSILLKYNNIETIYADSILNTSKNCPKHIKQKLKFISYNYPNQEILSSTKTIESINSSRILANQLFKGYSTLHLQEYFIQNTSNLLNTLIDLEEEKEEFSNYNNLIINSVYDSRIKEKFRRDFYHNKKSRSKNNTLNDLLNQVNTFQKPLPYSDEIFKKIYLEYVNSSKKKTDKYNLDTISFSSLSDKLTTNNAVLINIIAYDETYLIYSIKNSKLSLSKISKNEIESQFDSLQISLLNIGTTNFKKLNKFKNKIAKLLNLETGIKNIYLITDGNISSAPWEFVLDKYELFKYPNVERILNQQTIEISRAKFKMSCYSDNSTIKSNKKLRYAELPISFNAFNTISNELDISIENKFSGTLFNENKIRNIFNSDLSHISTHASSNTDNTLDNYLIIRDHKGHATELYSYDIDNLDSFPRVLILSACQTGIGKHEVGAGTFSLADACLTRGSETVIYSIWDVSESATAQLMISMYNYFAEGYTIKEALSNAKKELKKSDKYAHPYYWAGFVLEGNPNIYLKK